MTTPLEPVDPPEDPPENPDPVLTGPVTQADLDAVKLALTNERRNSKAATKRERELTAKLAELEASSMSDNDRAWQDKISAVQTAADARIKQIAARGALQSAGLQGKPDRLVGLLDLTDVTVDDNGNPQGLDDQVKALQDEFPGLFLQNSGGPAPVGTVNTGNRTVVKTEKSYVDQMNDQLGISAT